MKRIATLFLAAGLLFSTITGASAIDFKAMGQWRMGFGVSEISPIKQYRKSDSASQTKGSKEDIFQAAQRLRIQLDAVASEALSGTVYFEIGTMQWGKSKNGAALGADGSDQIKLKRAYLDWVVPQTEIGFRMGIQGVELPKVAGGSAVMKTDVAGVAASYKFNENWGATALWARPLNDNYDGGDNPAHKNYLDNMDLFILTVPMQFGGISATPWVMYGMIGANALDGYKDSWSTADGNLDYTLRPYPNMTGGKNIGNTSKGYGNAVWFGLPLTLSLWDPLKIEVDLNYGYVESMGRFDAQKNGVVKRSCTERQGFVGKALVEYKLDWGAPGIFGWYGTGDSGNPKNGSGRMPSIVPNGSLTSFMGDGNMGWIRQDFNVSYSGSWGIGAQMRNLGFIDDLTHTLRVAYWGGTNSTNMVKYMDSAYAWSGGWNKSDGPYLTTNDGLLEFNLINSYKIYENLEMNIELDYIANFMDNDTWKKAGARNTSFDKQDVWKAQIIFEYTF
ncbi:MULTISPECIES: outer membrane homotrimeric porin [unclassified Desulfovibrio]|uniref:outer membrane homotrimeric porin n=1 Tax=unclassified Desulfovibrio TaxID=2593640 RepID=UPI002FD9B7F5